MKKAIGRRALLPEGAGMRAAESLGWHMPALSITRRFVPDEWWVMAERGWS